MNPRSVYILTVVSLQDVMHCAGANSRLSWRNQRGLEPVTVPKLAAEEDQKYPSTI